MPIKNIDLVAKKLFIKTVAELNDQNEVEEFLNDLFSSAEVKDFSRRLLAAKMLCKNKTYLQINFEMGMSEGTINKIHFKTKGSPLIHKFFSN